MATAAYTYKSRPQGPISLTKLSVVLANLGLWASLILGLVIATR